MHTNLSEIVCKLAAEVGSVCCHKPLVHIEIEFNLTCCADFVTFFVSYFIILLSHF